MPNRNRNASADALPLRDRILPMLGSVTGSRSLLKAMLKRVLAHLHYGRLTIVLPDDDTLHFTGDQETDLRAAIHIHDWQAIRKLATGGDVAFAEAYMDGSWSSPDLTHLMHFAMRNETIVRARLAAGFLARTVARIGHLRNANTLEGSKRNIAYHYDLGNAFYRAWLDPSMTYSSGLYQSPDMSLDAAQSAKYERICELADLSPGEKVLEVGCGWGGFAELAAGKYRCNVTGLTLSNEQHAYARERLLLQGLHDRTDIVLRDYRHEEGQYDKIVSIEMFEAVGEEHWPTYFDMIRKRLKPGGKAVLQIITIDDDRFETYRRGADFIQRYIFPGGMLPSPTALSAAVSKAGLDLCHSEFFGKSYARTLAEWQRSFQHAWDGIAKQGFDMRFKRMWEYYLAYCETGFDQGSIDVGLFVIEHRENASV
ncbi:cyclopropane-fatty-acyl-phospholipid synthase family protein [Thalassospira sp.]|uniref:SAM-dependent methyltransferase n=1 Tax=Thalassospira sp. TaxID=1912094 RepID=UPI001B083507|nr:cyclopropane-fatty-acyl-phospholipid synthase family protein [Thalassospira sp.]MBO6808016.1 class I SAM-dependent methyltransferase [Thalassospira sp.]MBO6842042.1 class I SAM-dependent methyltransferase [Thalassospira sp.]